VLSPSAVPSCFAIDDFLKIKKNGINYTKKAKNRTDARQK
jgi:hypothetical protein